MELQEKEGKDEKDIGYNFALPSIIWHRVKIKPTPL